GIKAKTDTQERQAWSNKTEYILTSLGNAVGLGNIWRFPYKCHKHGGGAFLIPYLIMLVIVGYPLLLMEYSMGQRAKKGAIGVWSRVSPYTTGIGMASLVVCLILGLYYNVILALGFYYTANSLRVPLPWRSCPTVNTGLNNTAVAVKECVASSPTVYFWFRETLDVPVSIDQGEALNGWVVLASFVAWLVLFVGLVKGTTSTGKQLLFYLISTFRYLVLTAFAVRTLSLEGALDGIAFLFKPDVEKLKNPAAWLDALAQIFFSIGLGQGTYIAFASYTTTHNNCVFDTLFVATVNSLTSLFVALIVFGVLGVKAATNSKICGSVQMFYIPGGTGLAFITFCDAILNFPGSNFWSVLFFFMIVNIRNGKCPWKFYGSHCKYIILISAVARDFKMFHISAVMFCFGLTLTTKKGIYLVEILDDVYVGTGLLYIVLCETFAVALLYGIKRLGNDIYFMTGQQLNAYWKICIQFLCPILLLVCFGTIIVSY
uniref:Transporter n=1 Tax=Ciona savignyi TaxID=51511 RepID=H2YMI0_CIOSA